MSEIGEIQKGVDIGYKSQGKCVYHACIDCGKERWVQWVKGQPNKLRCLNCALKNYHPIGELNPAWKGGRKMIVGGYIQEWISPNDFFRPMADCRGYVMEHRLVMARNLGRCLQPWEKVHHKGIRYTDIKNKSDNLEDNLELTTLGSHTREHSKGYRAGYQKGLYDGRLKQIKELKEEMRRLQNDTTSSIKN